MCWWDGSISITFMEMLLLFVWPCLTWAGRNLIQYLNFRHTLPAAPAESRAVWSDLRCSPFYVITQTTAYWNTGSSVPMLLRCAAGGVRQQHKNLLHSKHCHAAACRHTPVRTADERERESADMQMLCESRRMSSQWSQISDVWAVFNNSEKWAREGEGRERVREKRNSLSH